MNTQNQNTPSVAPEAKAAVDLPIYESPRILELSERDILNSFQLTQSMAGWWTTM